MDAVAVAILPHAVPNFDGRRGTQGFHVTQTTRLTKGSGIIIVGREETIGVGTRPGVVIQPDNTTIKELVKVIDGVINAFDNGAEARDLHQATNRDFVVNGVMFFKVELTITRTLIIIIGALGRHATTRAIRFEVPAT